MYTYYGHKDDELIGAMELNKKNKTEPINNQSSKNSKK